MTAKMKRAIAVYIAMVLIMTAGASTVFAADDPLTVINNLSTFIFGLIRAIGMILLGFGIVQVGLSLKSHDPSQRANGFLTLAGGVIITFAKEILNLITGLRRTGNKEKRKWDGADPKGAALSRLRQEVFRTCQITG